MTDSTDDSPSDEADNDISNIQEDIDSMSSDIDSIRTDLTQLDGRYKSNIEDAREKIIQLKREIDNKPSEEDLEDILSETEENGKELSQIQERVTELENLLIELGETTETEYSDLDEKTLKLAKFSLDLQEDIDRLSNKLSTEIEQKKRLKELKSSTRELKREAHKKGIIDGACQNCSDTIELSLLDKPDCPHCDSTIEGFKSRYFRQNIILVETDEDT